MPIAVNLFRQLIDKDSKPLNGEKMPLELRRWFQVLTAVLGMLAAWTCWYIVDSALRTQADSVRLPLLALTIGSVAGFGRFLVKFLPVILAKLWPRIDRLPD